MGLTTTSKVLKVEDIGELRDLIASEPNLVVKYWATWCGPCRMFAPTFEKAADKVDATFVAVDIDAVPDVSVDYDVLGVPAVHHWRGGELVSKHTGAQRLVPLIESLS